ncbi:thymidylate synthase [Pseudoalteromonas sp. SS15]|uniref:thymidylate synthase n=1 Tax=Pseudoalteromonas sp. SS15 TaxID=3139393 RepID=UPI003BAA6D92
MSDRHIEGASVDDILHDTFDLLRNKGSKHEATKGVFIEYDSCLITLTNPVARLSRTDIKQTIYSCLGEFFWYLSGSQASEFISYYLKDYKNYAESDGNVHGAYGKRIFDYDGKFNQFEQVLNRLKEKPTTRQAVIQLFGAQDTARNYKDIPCTLSWQFMIRHGKLNMYVNMRSNDAYKGLPHDIFVFTMIQEIIALEMEVQVGHYHHYVGSLHLYEENLDDVERFVSKGFTDQAPVMAEMPKISDFASIKMEVLKYEELIRSNQVTLSQITEASLPKYWIDILLLLFSFSQKREFAKDRLEIGGYVESLNKIKAQFECPNYESILETKIQAERCKYSQGV